MKFQRIVRIVCVFAIVAISITVADSAYVSNWSHTAEDYAVAGNDVRVNCSSPGFYSGIGYCTAQVGKSSKPVTDGGVIWARVEGPGDYEVQEYKVKVYGTDRAKHARAWGWMS